MSQISTHILDTSAGKPAANVEVVLSYQSDQGWTEVARDTTNSDGRVADWLGDTVLEKGNYKLIFETGRYFRSNGVETLYPYVDIVFTITGDGQHYHVPLLLNPFGYSTYRGS